MYDVKDIIEATDEELIEIMKIATIQMETRLRLRKLAAESSRLQLERVASSK